ncbi:unnamed protein product [Peniophora sp. CBMAI 1063]|nr:unnamed protein product [Peniophora sp. CBMAI 1063]
MLLFAGEPELIGAFYHHSGQCYDLCLSPSSWIASAGSSWGVSGSHIFLLVSVAYTVALSAVLVVAWPVDEDACESKPVCLPWATVTSATPSKRKRLANVSKLAPPADAIKHLCAFAYRQ